jgi:hypothetical protein
LTALGTELAQAISPVSGLAWKNVFRTITEALHDHQVWRDGYRLTGHLAEGAARTREAWRIPKIQLEKSASCHTLLKGTDLAVLVAIALSADSLYMKPGYQALKQKFPEAHVCFVLYESKSVIAGPGQSSKQPEVPLLPFLEKQPNEKDPNGGGRNNRGGFRYETPTHIGNYEERRDSLLRAYR